MVFNVSIWFRVVDHIKLLIFSFFYVISDRHILIGSDEGIYTLNISQNDKEMEQVSIKEGDKARVYELLSPSN